MARRVVITGMGILSPTGNNIVDFNHDISSTLVRRMIQNNRISLCEDLVNQKVYDYIVDNKLYRN